MTKRIKYQLWKKVKTTEFNPDQTGDLEPKTKPLGGDDIHDQGKIKGQYDKDKLDKDAEAHPPTYDKIRKALIEKGIDPETPLAEIPKGQPPIIKKKK